MPKVPVYNIEGKETSTISLPDAMFGVKINPALVQQAIVTHQANHRHVLAHTKTRPEVRGGGRKPWRQKGTGRARHGSIRSPIWRGGGVTFGPRKNRNFSIKMNAKARRKALFMVLSDKVNDKQLVVVDGLQFEKPKTKDLVAILKKLPVGKKSLIVIPGASPEIRKSARNLPSVETIRADSINIFALLKFQSLIILKPSVKVLLSTFQKKSISTS